MTTIVGWIAEQALRVRKIKKIVGGPVGVMVNLGISSIKLIDKQFTENDISALNTARSRNGGCTHILLAYSSLTFSDGAPGEANDGDRDKTVQLGKRFRYADVSRLFWHPSVAFLPRGDVAVVYVGSKESVTAPSTARATLSAAPPTGKPSCPFCGESTLKSMKELQEYLKATGTTGRK